METEAEVDQLLLDGGESGLAAAQAWQITTPGSADWALSRLIDLRREAARADELEREAVARVKVRADALRARAERGRQFFESKLRSWAEANRAELLGGGKNKSVALLNGSCGWRKSGGGLRVVDEAAALEWARQQPVEADALRVKESVNVAAIKAAFKRSGEIPSGFEIEPEIESFTVRLDEDATKEE